MVVDETVGMGEWSRGDGRVWGGDEGGVSGDTGLGYRGKGWGCRR